MNYNMRYTQCQGKLYAGIPQPSECSAGKDKTTNPKQSCQYCKDTGHELPNCLQLQKKKVSHIQISNTLVFAWHAGKAVYCCAHAVQ